MLPVGLTSSSDSLPPQLRIQESVIGWEADVTSLENFLPHAATALPGADDSGSCCLPLPELLQLILDCRGWWILVSVMPTLKLNTSGGGGGVKDTAEEVVR